MTKEYIQDDGQLRVFIVPVDILDVPDLTSSEKLVYIVLRSYVNPTDPTAFPAYKTIAAKASLSRRRVIDIIKSLEEKGLIRKEARFTVTKERKIRDTSNTYTLITPKKAKTGETIAPPRVKPLHPPGETIAPYHNHLTESSLNMIECMNASEEIAAAHAESSAALESSQQNEIYESLREYIPKYVYVDGIPAVSYIDDIFLMLVRQFPNQLDPEVVRIAAQRYFDGTAQFAPGMPNNISMKLDVKNPVGLYKTCYSEAVTLYKAQCNSKKKGAAL